MLIDLHCHTLRSVDSSLDPDEAVEHARAAGLDAICFTEHDYLWPQRDVELLAEKHGFPVFAGVEVSTEIGHVLAYGLPSYTGELRTFESLVRVAERTGAVLILAHPYRRFFGFHTPEVHTEEHIQAALQRRGLEEVQAVESWNGGSNMMENKLAEIIAGNLGMPTTAGSDAHSTAGLGRWATDFTGEVRTVADLVEAVRAGVTRGTARVLSSS